MVAATVLVSTRLMSVPTVTVSSSVLLDGSMSVAADDTVAVLVTDGAASGPTSTTRVIVEVQPTSAGPAVVHETSAPLAEQDQPAAARARRR